MSDKPSFDEEEVIKEANDRFRTSEDWESYFRGNASFDEMFEAGDSNNQWQWPNEWLGVRQEEAKPTVTINKVQVHVKQVVNSGLRNKPSMAFKAVGDGASYQGAEVFQCAARQIEAESNATDAYDTAFRSAVKIGIGYWRVTSEYDDENSFDQSIKIKRIPNALSVYLDPNIKEINGSDARFGFIFDDMAKDQFEATYPKYKDLCNDSVPLGAGDSVQSQTTKREIVRVAEYYRIVEKDDTLHRIETKDENGNTVAAEHILESDMSGMDKSDKKELLKHSVKKRYVKKKQLQWFLIVGQQIIDSSILPGCYIPIVRVIGEERVINGTMDRNGLVRAMIDAQRVYNVMNSGAIEAVALQTKIPWLTTLAAIKAYQPMWDNQNIENPQYLLYDNKDEDGQEIPPPTRNEPPQYPQAFQQGIAQAANDMMMASGQHEASFGQESNERSGKAVNARSQIGENATYHFQNNLGVAITYTGMILLEWIPKVYDTPGRILKLLGEDGKPITAQIDPNMPQAHAPAPAVDEESIPVDQAAIIFNPNIGKYSVVADVGDNFATKNDQIFNALSQVTQQQPQLMMDFGDLLFQAMNIPLADKISERFRRIANPAALGIGPTPQEQQLQQLLQQQHGVLQQQAQEIQALKSKALVQETQKEIDEQKVMNDRFKIIADKYPQVLEPIVKTWASTLVGMPINQLIQQHMIENSQMIAAANPMPSPQGQPPMPNQPQPPQPPPPMPNPQGQQ